MSSGDSAAAFVPAYELVQQPGATPNRTAWILHGILGSRRNWRGFARALVQRFPDWRLLLLDLRNHGRSQGAPPPHTVAACAADLEPLVQRVGPADALIGHSFATKVLLVHATRAAQLPPTMWLLDGPLGAEANAERTEVARMVRALRTLPAMPATRDVVTRQLRELGFTNVLATWMASNLEPQSDGGLRWHFALDAVAEMLEDYWRLDLWDALAAAGQRTDVQVVVGARSDRWTPLDLDRLAELAARRTLALHSLAAGHWLHVEDPNGLLAAMAATFGAAP